MSQRNGDRSRFNRYRRKNIALRTSRREINKPVVAKSPAEKQD